jgi:hypothetical protein
VICNAEGLAAPMVCQIARQPLVPSFVDFADRPQLELVTLDIVDETDNP